ncbi:fatty acid desaturase, partial [Leptolyngbya sp. FACHB-711]|uniref:fatty acid desaturase n=1 Tax=Leptolyngbya sp. FACHB-711 TaxID=2692813 RepID=UPI00321FD817
MEQKAASESSLALIIALGVIGIWAASLIGLLSLNLNQIPGWVIPAMMLWQMFLYTGLFITAHDAMHGALFPSNIKVNNTIGTLCVLLYGLFSYKKLLKKHWMHHHHPASELDPDFHDGKHKNP